MEQTLDFIPSSTRKLPCWASGPRMTFGDLGFEALEILGIIFSLSPKLEIMTEFGETVHR